MIPLGVIVSPAGAGAAIVGWIAQHWRLLAALALAGFAWFQTERLEGAQDDLAKLNQSIKTAGKDSALQGAQTGLEAVTRYVDKQEADAPVVARVAARVESLCVPAANHLPVPKSPASVDEAPSRAQDDADRTFAAAIREDLATCQAELNRFTELQAWLTANGG